ncbi:MAG TPA: PAS domain S-box protein [Gemmataceae bacterium]|jgi:PAS domain S-box-containing protein
MRRGIQLGFMLTLVVLVGNAVFAVLNTRAVVETAEGVDHTHDVLRQLSTVQLHLTRAETCQRGYLLTGDESYLEPYRAARSQAADDLRRLRDQVPDDPARLQELEARVGRKLDTFDTTDERFRAGGRDAALAVVRGDGRAAMEEVRRMAAAMQDGERLRLRGTAARLQDSGRRSLMAFALATALALAALVWEFNAVRRDLRQRERAARELRDQREQFRATLASIGDGVIVTDTAGRVTFLNPVAEALTGWGQDAVGRPLPEVFRAVDDRTGRPVEDPAALALRRGGTVVMADPADLIARDGAARPIDDSAAPMRDATGALVGAVVVFRDVSDRRRAQEALREHAALLDEATDAILVEDPDGRVTFWNRGAERLYGWRAAEAIGRESAELTGGSPIERAEPLAAVAVAGEWVGELHQARRDGRAVIVASRWTLLRDAAGRPRSRLVINTDVTDRKKLEAQLLRGQRLESIGTLAGGIAHDLNNVLTPVLMGLDILRTAPEEAGRLGVLETMRQAAQRGAELVRQVLLFSRGGEGPRAVVSLKPLIAEVERFITHTFPKTVAVRVDVPGDLWPAPVDATQFTQVVMNLAVNARDAMPEGGELLIRAENLVVDDHYARLHPGAKPGRHVAVTVADTGTGIDPDVQERMFDPFFTTKPLGLGTGLGLSTVLGIVRAHGGFLSVYSEPGRGTRFVVCLPAAKSSKEVRPASAIIPAAGNGELILVVDDEAAIAQITRHTLEAHGYRVLTAADGARAVDLFREHRGEVRVVLTDMMMPVQDGPATIRAIRRLDPAVPIIAASGLSDPARAVGDMAGEVAATLQKPFTAATLVKTVRTVLAKATANGAGRAAP